MTFGNEFYKAYKINFIDKWNTIEVNNKEEKVKFLQQHLKDIRKYNPRKLRKLVALKIVELGAKSEATYRECINAGIYLVKSGLIEGPQKISLLQECEKKCSRLFQSLKFNQKEKKLLAAKDNYQIQKLLVEESLKLNDYNSAKSWLTKLDSTSDSVRDPKILINLEEDMIRLKGQVRSCMRIYKQFSGKMNYIGNLKKSFNNHLFIHYFSPSFSLPYYEESNDRTAVQHLKTLLAFQNKGKKVLKSPSYLSAKDTNLPPQLLLTKLSKINKIKDSAIFIQNKLNEGHHQYYKPIIISTYELINSDGVHLPNKNLDLKPFFNWALSITKGIDPEILFNYLPKLITLAEDATNNLSHEDRSFILKNIKISFKAIKKKLHLYKFQNEPAPKIVMHPRVKEWYSKSKQERRGIVRDVYTRLRNLNGGQDSKGIYIRDLSLSINSSCTYTENTFWALAKIPFTRISINHFSGLLSLTVFKDMPLENVNVSWSSVKDIGALSGKVNLRVLNITGTGVKSINDLKGLNLTEFYMDRARQISDISALEGMPIKRLDISGTRVNSLRHLKGMPLERLTARNLKQLKSIAPLEHTLLKDLNINGCKSVKSLAPLKKLKISYLYIEETAIDDLSPLSRMALKNLYFTKSYKIKSLVPIRWMQIERLGISHHILLSQALKYHFPLSRLKMSYTKIKSKDLSLLKNFELNSLELFGCDLLKDLRPLKLSPSLKTLNIGHCKLIRSLRGINETNIESLYMEAINIKDLSQLADSKITRIQARHSLLVTLKGISKFPISSLDIRYSNKLIDISELPESTLKNLEIRWCDKLKNHEPVFRTNGLRHDLR